MIVLKIFRIFLDLCFKASFLAQKRGKIRPEIFDFSVFLSGE
jgi:hypothetical protein